MAVGGGEVFTRGEGGRPGKGKGETWGGRGREIQFRGGGREGGEHGEVRGTKREGGIESREMQLREGAGRRGRRDGKKDKGEDVQSSCKEFV